MITLWLTCSLARGRVHSPNYPIFAHRSPKFTALRDQGLPARLHANDGGVVTPPRYLPDWGGQTVRNSSALATYSRRLADRVQKYCLAGAFPLVLGGDCSILLGSMLALRRMGHYGLVFIDGHLDFRHPGNAQAVIRARELSWLY